MIIYLRSWVIHEAVAVEAVEAGTMLKHVPGKNLPGPGT